MSGALGRPVAPQSRLRALAATATIGTDRVAGNTTAVDALLTEAATCGLRARAGWRPRIHADSLAPCPPDDRPIAPAAAIARLQMFLAERDGHLIEEWATHAVARGMRVDGATAPLLLDWWARQTRRPPAVFAALGRLGEWLASLNPDWGQRAGVSELPADADTRWQLGTSAERLALLTSVRRIDPPRALTLLASTWEEDAAADRQRFVDILMDQASMGDEPFLEAALDDRSKVVRRQAAAVLARVPGSRLRQRLSAAARRFIAVHSRGLVRQRTAIALQPPEAFDPSWERDGIEPRPPKGVGQRAWWLRQILAGADLAIWTDATGLTPPAVLEALQGDDFAADAFYALVAAARLARDPEWSAALARQLARRAPVEIDTVVALLQALPDADAERLALEIAGAETLTALERWETIAAIDRPWSPAFSRDVMTMLIDRVSKPIDDAWRASQLLAFASRRLDPDARDLFEHAAMRSFKLPRAGTLTSALDRVRVRAEMRKELSS